MAELDGGWCATTKGRMTKGEAATVSAPLPACLPRDTVLVCPGGTH